MIPVKICGITRLEDALSCIRLGVSALGFVFAESKRRISVAAACEISRKLPPFVMKVGVFVNEDPYIIRDIMKDCSLDLAQLHGEESTASWDVLSGRVIKVFKAGLGPPDTAWRHAPIRAVLVDSYSAAASGGTGKTFDWRSFEQYRILDHPLILAGGLNPGNVREAIAAARPDGVDLSSGVESSPGIKDPAKIRDLMLKIRDCKG